LYAQPDTVFVDDFYVADSSKGTLNTAIQNVIESGQLSQTVFKLSSNSLYIFNDIIVILPGDYRQKIAGRYTILFNGSQFSTGVYYYRLVSKDFTATKKLSLVK
jgi:hypothetical protein